MIKQFLQNNQPVYGTWQRIPSSVVSDVLSLTPVDFVTVDMEHGAIDISDLRQMVPVFQKGKKVVIVRAASRDAAYISKVLDLGVDGIMVPRVQTAAEVQDIVDKTKLAPIGKRGVGGACAADRFGDMEMGKWIPLENERVLTIVQIEDQEAMSQLDEMVKVKGVDLFYVGPFDLSQSFGLTGQITHPRVTEAIHQIVDTIRLAGLPVGIHAADLDFLRYWKANGVTYFTHGMDTTFLKQMVRGVFQDLHGIKG